MPPDSPGSGLKNSMLAAYRAAYPGSPAPSKKALREFIKRDFEAIMVRLDAGIARSRARFEGIVDVPATRVSDRVLERLCALELRVTRLESDRGSHR